VTCEQGRGAFLLALGSLVFITTAGCGGDSAFRLPDPAVRYVAFGDSTTKGPSERDYVTFLPGLLGEGTEAFANEGKGGELTADGVDRLRSLISRRIFPNARVLLYWEGAKDLIEFIKKTDPLLGQSPDSEGFPFSAQLSAKLDEVQANIESAIKAGRQAGLQVVIATYFFLPPGSLDCEPLLLGVLLPGQAANANQYVTRLNDRIRKAASNQGAVLVDVATLDSTLRGSSANYTNCNHLSAQGNEIVAKAWANAIRPGTGG
jgi:lysophospholipase L1-like esterase